MLEWWIPNVTSMFVYFDLNNNKVLKTNKDIPNCKVNVCPNLLHELRAVCKIFLLRIETNNSSWFPLSWMKSKLAHTTSYRVKYKITSRHIYQHSLLAYHRVLFHSVLHLFIIGFYFMAFFTSIIQAIVSWHFSLAQ